MVTARAVMQRYLVRARTTRTLAKGRLVSLDPSGVAALRAYLDQIWGDALTAFQAFVEQQPEATQPAAEPADQTP